MAEVNLDYTVDSYELSQEDIDALGGDASLITSIKVWDPNPPKGWLIVSLGQPFAIVTCPKPCSRITDPPPIS